MAKPDDCQNADCFDETAEKLKLSTKFFNQIFQPNFSTNFFNQIFQPISSTKFFNQIFQPSHVGPHNHALP